MQIQAKCKELVPSIIEKNVVTVKRFELHLATFRIV
jgi:hypothetical protein